MAESRLRGLARQVDPGGALEPVKIESETPRGYTVRAADLFQYLGSVLGRFDDTVVYVRG